MEQEGNWNKGVTWDFRWERCVGRKIPNCNGVCFWFGPSFLLWVRKLL